MVDVVRGALLLLGVFACSRALPTTTAPVPARVVAASPAVDAGPCAEPDRDGDGLVDVCDACPDDAGPRPDGCPRRVEIQAEEIRITPQLYFEVGSAAVTPAGRPVLDEIAAVMRAHPELRVVEVQGHASVGERGASSLAQRRAEAARDDLVARGVEAGRLVARGYGVDRPRDAGPTREARARNRRVEFSIAEVDAPPRRAEPPRQVVPAGCPDAPPPRVGPCSGGPTSG